MLLGNVLPESLYLLKGAVTVGTVKDLVALVNNSRPLVSSPACTRPAESTHTEFPGAWQLPADMALLHCTAGASAHM